MSDSLKNFAWADIGDIAKGRPTLGMEMNVVVYRMFQYSLRKVLEKHYDREAVRHHLVEAGRLSGLEFCRHVLDMHLPPDSFIDLLMQKMKELGIGILQVEYADFENMIFILTVSEDLDCSGLPVTGATVCHYDEGLIMGILEMYTGRQLMVKEVDCWSTGAGMCRFNVVAF
jgi:predicted hydrocarbon binding protein